MKKFLALVLALVMTMSLVTIGANAKTADFSDAKEITNVEAVDVLSEMGILVGQNNVFSPKATITRGAAAKIITYLAIGEKAADALTASGTIFKDVPANSAVAPYVEYLAKNGVINGYGDKVFGLKDKVTINAFVKMLLGVIGYGQDGEFVGGGWQANVIAKATQLDIMDGTEKAGYCLREEAAQFALNSLLCALVSYNAEKDMYFYGQNAKAGTVVVYPESAGGTNNGIASTGYMSIADRFDMAYEDDTNVWGDPGHSWTIDGDEIGTYMDAPVLSYTTEVDACQILQDLGIAKTSKSSVIVDYAVEDGALIDNTTIGLSTVPTSGKGTTASPYQYANTDLELSHKASNVCVTGVNGENKVAAVVTDGKFGGQGALTQVYKTGKNTYVITTVNTYLAQVTKATEDSHGDLASLNLSVYDDAFSTTEDPASVAKCENFSGKYAKNDYVLVNMLATGNDFGGTADDAYVNEVVTPVATGALTAYRAKVSTTVGGTKYDDACKFDLGYQGDYNKTYNVYVDQYGNIIGLTVPDTVYTYGVFDAISWQNSVTSAGSAATRSRVLGDIVNMDAAVANGTIISKEWNLDGTIDTALDILNAEATNQAAERPTNNANTAKLSTDSENNKVWTLDLYKFTTNADGETVIDKVGAYAENIEITKGTHNRFAANAVTNENTQYLVKTLDAKGHAVYEAVTGYENIKSMKPVKVSYFTGDDGYVTYCFVDATAATAVVDSTIIAAVFSNVSSDMEGGLKGYDVWKLGDTAASTLYAAEDKDTAYATAVANDGLYQINLNAAGQILSAEAINAHTDDGNYAETIFCLSYAEKTVLKNTNALTVKETETDAAFYEVIGDEVYTRDLAYLQGILAEKQDNSDLAKYTVTAYVLYKSTGDGYAVYFEKAANGGTAAEIPAVVFDGKLQVTTSGTVGYLNEDTTNDGTILVATPSTTVAETAVVGFDSSMLTSGALTEDKVNAGDHVVITLTGSTYAVYKIA